MVTRGPPYRTALHYPDGVISRRAALGGTALLGLAAAGGATHLLGVDDDVLRALGARPKPLPHEGDAALLRSADADQREILSILDAVIERHPDVELDDLRTLAAEQLEAISRPGTDSGPTPPVDVAESPSTALDSVADRVAEIGALRQAEALEAYSSALVTILASLSAGHAQLARTLRRRARATSSPRRRLPTATVWTAHC